MITVDEEKVVFAMKRIISLVLIIGLIFGSIRDTWAEDLNEEKNFIDRIGDALEPLEPYIMIGAGIGVIYFGTQAEKGAQAAIFYVFGTIFTLLGIIKLKYGDKEYSYSPTYPEVPQNQIYVEEFTNEQYLPFRKKHYEEKSF